MNDATWTERIIAGSPEAIGHWVWRLEFLEREVARVREDIARLRRQILPTDAVSRP